MKIVFTNENIYGYASGAPQVVGGAERQQWLLARALAASGWSVTVALHEATKVGERRAIEGVEFAGIDQGQILLAWYRFLQSERPDWWYWRCSSHLLGPAVAIGKLRGVGMIFSAASDRDLHPCHALLRRRRWWPLYAWGLSQADRILVQHGGQFSDLPLQWQSKAYTVPSIAGDTVSVKPHRERKKDVGWVAMLRHLKRPDLLIDIARRTDGVRFVVCGGPMDPSPPGYSERIVEELRALPNVEYRGLVSPDDALRVIANSAILLSTSDIEGFPSTFLEGWSSGTPVVSLKIDPDNIIQRLGLGAVSGSVERAVADIGALMASPQRREEIAAHARQYVAANHSEAAVVAAFERAIRGAC